jgi:hypothetical protein
MPGSARIFFASLCSLALAPALDAEPLGTGAAHPAIAVELDRSRILAVPEGTRIVAIGNPAIADALIAGQNLILTGKAAGATNLLATDDAGRVLLDAEISVSPAAEGVIRVYRGTKRRILHCAPLCEPTAPEGAETGEARSSGAAGLRQAKMVAAKGLGLGD